MWLIFDVGQRMKPLLMALTVLLGCGISTGCKSPMAAMQSTRTLPREGTVQGDLSRLAAGFTDLVVAIGREPNQNESLGEFVRSVPLERLKKLPTSVHLDQKGALVISDGSEVTWTRKFESCFLFVDGSSDTSMRYTFSATTHTEASEAQVALHYGGPVVQK
jgi:hypothetical protein